jgi:hypothetical protein
MMTNPSIFRQTFDGMALFAVLNLLGMGGLVAYLVGSGAVDTEKLRRMVAVMRGEDQVPPEAEPIEQPTGTVTEATKVSVGADTGAKAQMNIEIMRLEGDRIKAELDQRLALNNSILLRVTTERENFQREVEEAARQRTVSQKRRQDEGFKKQVAIYEALAPKVSIQHLLSLPEPDEAAKILLQMDTRKAKKIVEAAKRSDQMAKMKVILQRIREVSPERLAALESSEG